MFRLTILQNKKHRFIHNKQENESHVNLKWGSYGLEVTEMLPTLRNDILPFFYVTNKAH